MTSAARTRSQESVSVTEPTDETTTGGLPGSGGGASPEGLALVKRLPDGDEAAFTHVVQQYHDSLLRLAMVFISDRAVAEEIVQETWLGVLKGLASFQGRSALRSWIFRILTNRAKTRAVREKRTIATAEKVFAAIKAKRAQQPRQIAAGRSRRGGEPDRQPLLRVSAFSCPSGGDLGSRRTRPRSRAVQASRLRARSPA